MSSTGSTQESAMATKKADKAGRSDAKQTPKPAAKGGAVAITLPETMNGKASAAKAAVGDKPVFAYIASLPQPQRGIAERSEEHTSELQSLMRISYAVFCLKKKHTT